MKKSIIQFSHGNSYPASCYKQMLQPLEQYYSVNAVEMFGHNPNYPVTDSWPFLVKELIDTIEAYADEPVIGLGHSLGGVLTLMAAAERPDLFKNIIILDSPVFGKLKSMFIKWFKQLGLIDKITPGGNTLQRTQCWSDAENALDYLKTKKVYKNFTDECLKDYIQYGMEVTPEGLKLKYDVETEYQIYRTIPHHLSKIKKALNRPIELIYGLHSDVLRPYDVKAMNKDFHDLRTHSIEGGHLFPFENPQKAAELILRVIGVH